MYIKKAPVYINFGGLVYLDIILQLNFVIENPRLVIVINVCKYR